MANRVFAVDLGAWSVKLAIASPGLRGAALLHVVEREVPPGDEPVEQRARAVLARLVDELHLRDDTGYLGVYGDQVFTQVLEFGFKSLKRAELEKAVGGELEDVVPVDLEDMVYTFESIPPAVAPVPLDPAAAPDPVFAGPKRGRVAAHHDGLRVLSYAMRRERAEQLIQLGKDCGFEPRGILACGGAAAKLVERVPSLVRARVDGPVAVIDIGHERTDVVIVAQGKAVFSRSIGRAGKAVTEAIQRHWKGLDFAAAERAKHADGFIASQAEPATSEAWVRVHQALVDELRTFARDLRQTIAACRARTGFAPIAALLVGGGSRLNGLGSFLTEQLGIPAWRITGDDAVALAGPRLGAESVASSPIDSAALTIGMAYEVAGGRPQFDLRQGPLAVRVDLSFLRAKAVPLAAAAIAMLAFAAGSAYADLYRLNKSEKVLAQRLADDSQDVFHERRTAEAVLDSSGPSVTAALSPMPKMSAYDVLLEISSKIPAKDKITLDLDSLVIDESKVDINGTTKLPAEIDLLVAELKKVDCFKDVTRGGTDTGPNGVQKFKITINATCM